MRKTYAYNSIIFGVLIGILVWASTENVFLGILACIGISVVGFVLIRIIEKAIYKGTNAAINAATNAYQKHKEQKEEKK